MRTKLRLLYLGLVSLTIIAWAWLALSARAYPSLFPLGILAYVFGLRHALDADHIAAIDNTTRKMMNEGQKPIGVGFFFALGHSTIVVLLTVIVTFSARLAAQQMPFLERLGDLVGTVISAGFLYLIALLNLVILRDVYRLFQKARASGLEDEEDLDRFLAQRGLMTRLLGPLFRLIRHSWQMYPVGVLFGLGFDTASEVALLGMSATAGAKNLPSVLILVLPLLFAAGMILVDTTDGVLMSLAYHWAFKNALRKIYYNLTITAISVLIALVIGTAEWLQVVGQEFAFSGPFWGAFRTLHFGTIGYGIVAILIVTWGISVLIYRMKGYDQIPKAKTTAEKGGAPWTI